MCAAELGITCEDRILCLAPYTHLYGLYTVQLGLATGATTCLLDLFTPPGFVRALQTFRPTILFAGPAHVAPCLQQNLFQGVDFSGLRVAVVTGSTVPASLSAAFEALLPDGKVLQAWGMTELQFGACSRPSDAREIRFETIGRATPGTELRVADADGRVLQHGETGELQVRGCSLFSGYEKNEEINKSSFTADHWFRTGDLASMDAQGNVRLRGRTKELINRGGVKFNPIDMEIAIAGHPAVANVAIAPLPDEVLTERAACFVILKPGASLSFDELKAFLAERKFAKFTWPEHLAVVAEMPMTPTRKVMKADLVQQYLAANPGLAGVTAMTLPLPLPKSHADIARIQSERKRVASGARRPSRGIAASSTMSTPMRSMIPPSGGRSPFWTRTPAQAHSRRVPGGVLRGSRHRDRGILALGRLDRAAGILSAHTRRPAFRRAVLGPLVSLHGYRPRRSLPHLVSARRPSGRAGLGAQRATLRRRHDLGRRRQCSSLGGATRPDPDVAPDRVHRHEQLRAASRQSRRSEGN